jgi:trimeric autotransporter adhesin
LTADSTGNLYFVAPNEVRVRKVSATGIITTVAGNGSRGLAGDGGPATAAQFEIPEGLAVDAAGNLYIADSERIRRISATGTITTVAGGVGGYSGDGGPASAAQFNDIQGIAFDGKGNLFVADFGNALVREISAQGLVSTIEGNGYPSYSGSNGPAVSAQLDMPQGIAVDNSGNVYFVDKTTAWSEK